MGVADTDIESRPDPLTHEPAPRPLRARRGVPSHRLRGALPYCALGFAAFIVAVFVHHLVFPAYSWNRDEITYLWQTDALSSGKLVTDAGGFPSSFWPWLAGFNGHYFSQYGLGWPVVLLAVETVFGSPALALPVGTVMTVLGAYCFTREITRDQRLALVTGVLMLASPLVVLHSGIYLSYLFALGLGLFSGAALFAGIRRRSWWQEVLAGGLLGWLLLTRPFDVILWALPFAAYAVLLCWRRWKDLLRAASWAAIGFAPFVVITLAYNYKVTGSVTQFPLTAKDPLDTLFFGTRRLMPADPTFEYTIGTAVRSTLHHLRVLPPFVFGSWLAIGVGLVGLWFRRRERSSLLLLALMAIFPIGYFFFWGTLLSSHYAGLTGPLYYIPLFVPICVFVAAALLRLWDSRRWLAVVTGAALVAVSVPAFVVKVGVNHTISEAQLPWKNGTRTLHDPSLVIVQNSGPYLMHLNPYSMNGPNLDDTVLFAADRGGENLDLIAAYPWRTPYLERTSDPRWDDPVNYHDAPPPVVSLVPLSVVEGTQVTLRVHVVAPSSGPVVVASLQLGSTIDSQNVVTTRVLSTTAQPGQAFDTTFTVAAPSQVAGDAVPLAARLGNLSVTVGAGTSIDAANDGRQTEEHFSFRVVDDRVTQVLTPGRSFIARSVKGKKVLRAVDDPKALDVELTANR